MKVWRMLCIFLFNSWPFWSFSSKEMSGSHCVFSEDRTPGLRGSRPPEPELLLFSGYVLPDSWGLHRLQHTRLPGPSPSPEVRSNSCPLSQWCHPTVSSSFISFSSWLQSLPHQSLFQWIRSSHQVAKVLEFQHQSFQWIFRIDFL